MGCVPKSHPLLYTILRHCVVFQQEEEMHFKYHKTKCEILTKAQRGRRGLNENTFQDGRNILMDMKSSNNVF